MSTNGDGDGIFAPERAILKKQPLPQGRERLRKGTSIILQLCAEHFEQKEKDTNETNPHKSKKETI